MECLERGWGAPETFVCADCVEDDFLKEVIADNLAKRKCDYCRKGARRYIAAPIEAIMEPIASALRYRFDISHDDRDASTEDALRALPLQCTDNLLKAVAEAFEHDRWSERISGFEAPGMSMAYSWQRFADMVSRQSRFFFSAIKPRVQFHFEHSPTALLEEIGRIVSSNNLIKQFPAEPLFRVRYWPGGKDFPSQENYAREMGAPPNEKAQAQRMNPAGISYLYLGRDKPTALAEVLSKPPCRAALGTFKTHRPLMLLDLTELPPLPSIFQDDSHEERELLEFLEHFVKAITKPVRKDGMEHVEYIPSQVVSEYFAKIFGIKDDKTIDGMAYPSAVRPGGSNVVLFPPYPGRNDFSDLVECIEVEEIAFDNWAEFSDAILCG